MTPVAGTDPTGAPEARCAIGVDVGGTKIAAGVVTGDGRLVFASRVATPVGEGALAVCEAVTAAACAAVQEARSRGLEALAVGVGTGGQVDARSQRVVGSTAVLPGWSGVPLRERVQQATGLAVFVDNDAKVAARAELAWGSARGLRHAVFVTLGTGVGGALAVDGRVLDGARGFAGHIGHVTVRPDGPSCSCGRRGCLEVYASATGIVRLAREFGGPGVAVDDATDVFRLARDGASWAERALAEAASALGQALADAVHVLNPEAIVVGGGLSAWGEPWLARIEGALRRRLMEPFQGTVALRLAAFGPQAGVLGAAALAFERLAGSPAPAGDGGGEGG